MHKCYTATQTSKISGILKFTPWVHPMVLINCIIILSLALTLYQELQWHCHLVGVGKREQLLSPTLSRVNYEISANPMKNCHWYIKRRGCQTLANSTCPWSWASVTTNSWKQELAVWCWNGDSMHHTSVCLHGRAHVDNLTSVLNYYHALRHVPLTRQLTAGEQNRCTGSVSEALMSHKSWHCCYSRLAQCQQCCWSKTWWWQTAVTHACSIESWALTDIPERL